MKKFPWLRLLIHILGLVPLSSIIISGISGSLGVNPIQELEQRLGRAALYCLLAALSITPLVTLTGWQALLPRRRALGLYAFFYASLHFATFVAIDYAFDFQEIGRLILEKPYILVGLLTGILLLPLAITSSAFFIRRLRKRWKILHRLAYLAGLTAMIHFAWARKGNLLSLSGDILQPLLLGGLLVILLVMRIPSIRRLVSAWRLRIVSSLSSR